MLAVRVNKIGVMVMMWLWLGPKKGGIVIAKSIFIHEYEINLDNFATL